MAQLDVAQKSLLTAPSKPIGHLSNKVPACEIWHDGSPAAGTVVNAATMQYATATLTLSINGSADSRVGSSGALACSGATLNTFGELSDAINKVDGWHCRLLAVKRSDSTNATLEDSGSALDCYHRARTLLIDTDALEMHSYCVTAAEGVSGSNRGRTFADKVKAIYDEHGHRNCLFYLKVNPTYTGTNAVATMTIYSVNGATNSETLLGTFILGATTVVNTFDFTKMPIVALEGERLVVRICVTADANANLASITESLIVAKSIKV